MTPRKTYTFAQAMRMLCRGKDMRCLLWHDRLYVQGNNVQPGSSFEMLDECSNHRRGSYIPFPDHVNARWVEHKRAKVVG